MRSNPSLLLAGALALLLACACRSACSGEGPAPMSQELPHEVLLRGDDGTFTGFTLHLVREDHEWEALWPRIAGRRFEPPPAPRVDFAQRTLILLALGERPSAGYGLEVRSLERRDVAIALRVAETRPLPDSMQAQVVTSPYLVLSLPRHEGPLELVIE